MASFDVVFLAGKYPVHKSSRLKTFTRQGCHLLIAMHCKLLPAITYCGDIRAHVFSSNDIALVK
jgi:hypothetical protein